MSAFFTPDRVTRRELLKAGLLVAGGAGVAAVFQYFGESPGAATPTPIALGGGGLP